jgi:glycosyltransferase involved in cell wall biosynthesis
MKLTIVTPTLDVEAVVDRALRSVRDQSFAAGGGLEHLVLDGGSRDGTLDVVRRHPHVLWVSAPDRGVFDAMNEGIARARGEWIHFLGADDALHAPDVLERIAPELEAPWDVVYGDVVGPRFEGRYDGPFDAEKLLRRNICHQAIFFRRRLFERLGGFDLRYPANADWEHNLRWFFDPDTRSKWVDLVVADFGADGLSSRGDPAWRRDRRLAYVRYGMRSLPPLRCASLLLRETWRAVRRADPHRVRDCLALGARVARRPLGVREAGASRDEA